jgi:hypothetical protein
VPAHVLACVCFQALKLKFGHPILSRQVSLFVCVNMREVILFFVINIQLVSFGVFLMVVVKVVNKVQSGVNFMGMTQSIRISHL